MMVARQYDVHLKMVKTVHFMFITIKKMVMVVSSIDFLKRFLLGKVSCQHYVSSKISGGNLTGS